MRIPPSYNINSEILELIAKIDANKIFFSSITIPSLIKEKIQRMSLLKSSLFSARIEGNPLSFEDLKYERSDAQKKIEVFNILKTIEFIDKNITPHKKITKKIILILHGLAMDNLPVEKGVFRKEMGAIFNQAGVAVYLPPPPQKISGLLNKLLVYINSDFEKFPLINAFIAHLIFEKIHPFIDGNGRVGRLLIFLILKSNGQNFNIGIPFEEYLDENKSDYYYHLDNGLSKTEEYLMFMLKSFYFETEKIKELITHELEKKEEILLPPRQEEILNIIKDHAFVSFDMLRRRFLKIPERTLRYDLKKLFDMNLIIKIGKTKGSYYKIKN